MKHTIPIELELRLDRDEWDTAWVGEVLLFGVVVYRNAYLVCCDTEDDAAELLKKTFAHALSEQLPNEEPKE